MKKKIYLHIGTHKTGTSAIQSYMNQYGHKNNIDFYKGMHNPKNHAELHGASMRIERESPFKKNLNIVVNDEYKNKVIDHVRTFINESTAETIVFSAEGLSYLRYEDEVQFLRDLFTNHEVHVIVYLRDKASFIKSYENQVRKTGGTPSKDPNSYEYIHEDSWLLDYDTLISVYKRFFGENIHILSYESELEREGSVIPSFLKTIGLPYENQDIILWENKSETEMDKSEKRIRSVLKLNEIPRAELFREIALVMESHQQIESAKLMMEKALELRPQGPFIKQKVEEYQRLLQESQK